MAPTKSSANKKTTVAKKAAPGAKKSREEWHDQILLVLKQQKKLGKVSLPISTLKTLCQYPGGEPSFKNNILSKLKTQKNAIAILNMPRMVQKEAEKAARRCIAQDRAKRKAAKEMGLPSPDSSLSPSSSSSSPSSSPLLVSSPVATEGSNRASKQAGSVSGGIVPCSHDASYRNAPGSISPDGRCGLRSILQYLFELLGEERFLVLLFRQGLSLPPDVNFAWGGSRDLRKWLDELWQDCFSKYLRLIISEEIRQDANSSLSLISAEDIKRTQSGELVYTGECERIREKIYKNTRTIGNPSSDRLMDERIGYVIGSILDVNIYAIQQGQDPQPFYGVATSGITVTLNFDGRHFDIQGHQPHDPPRNSY